VNTLAMVRPHLTGPDRTECALSRIVFPAWDSDSTCKLCGLADVTEPLLRSPEAAQRAGYALHTWGNMGTTSPARPPADFDDGRPAWLPSTIDTFNVLNVPRARAKVRARALAQAQAEGEGEGEDVRS
jgi:hypothetical protein